MKEDEEEGCAGLIQLQLNEKYVMLRGGATHTEPIQNLKQPQSEALK